MGSSLGVAMFLAMVPFFIWVIYEFIQQKKETKKVNRPLYTDKRLYDDNNTE